MRKKLDWDVFLLKVVEKVKVNTTITWFQLAQELNVSCYALIKNIQRVYGKKGDKPSSIVDSLSGVTIQAVEQKVKNKDINKVEKEREATLEEHELARLGRANQRLRDQVRINNKTRRILVRDINSVEKLYGQILEKLPKIKIKTNKKKKISKIETNTAIVQLSDLHLNEVVISSDTIGSNEFNYEIASKRLLKYARKVKDFIGKDVTHIVVAFTGDLINSDRHIDEVLTNAGNRAEALVFAVQVLSQFLLDLMKDYHVTVVSVMGNESRIDKDVVMCNRVTHNYDFLIHKFLQQILSPLHKEIDFLEIERNYERVLKICGANILITHGALSNNWKKSVTKYAQSKVLLDYMIVGHKHSTLIDDRHSRSSSMVGGNFYSTFKLNLAGRASQNLYLIEKEKGYNTPSIIPIAIDLQNVEGESYYEYEKDVCKEGMRKSTKKADKIIIEIVT